MILNISYPNNFLIFNIKDDGIGFDTSTLKTGNGLINLKERCKIIHADLKIISAPNEGTEVIISLNNNEKY
jgi:signal transduction histidine kinase